MHTKSGRSKGGRNGPFTSEQIAIIEHSLPKWRAFSLIENVDLGGRGVTTKLTEWKQKEAKRILALPEFVSLPEGVSTCSVILLTPQANSPSLCSSTTTSKLSRL
jgi:hypothetical protein